MSPAGALALLLCVFSVGTALAQSPPTVADAVRKWADSANPDNAAVVLPNFGTPPADPAGRTRTHDVAGRATVYEPAPLGSRVIRLDGIAAIPAPATPTVGLVYEPEYTIDPDLRKVPAAYVPQVGDIVLVVSDNIIWKLLFALSLNYEPYHIGVVVRRCDGGLGMLEAGPPDVAMTMRNLPLAERLASDTGRVYIRRRSSPLTAAQADALNGFAARQEGKPYAYIRFLCQGTPLRCRGPIRTQFIGHSRGEPFSYFCSELVIEALVSAGLVDSETARPRATAPADVFYDESTNPWINKHLKLYPEWTPPQRWVAEKCVPRK